jgi:hypothetical protein
MPGPAYYSGTMYIAQNEDWACPFVYSIVNPISGVITGPVNLTGSTLKMEIRVQDSDQAAIVSVFSPSNGIQLTNAAAGLFTIAITRDKLVRLFPGTFVVDLVRLMPNGYQERIWEGTAEVVEGTTR